MRASGLILLGVVSACSVAEAPTCSESVCVGLCDEAIRAQGEAAGPGELVYLDPFESERLSDLLPQVVRGVLPAGEPAMWVCAGGGPCGDSPRIGSGPVPPGLYAVGVHLVVPPRGAWRLTASLVCSDATPPTVEVDLTPHQGKVVRLDPVATFEVPSDATDCQFRVSAGTYFFHEAAVRVATVRDAPRPRY